MGWVSCSYMALFFLSTTRSAVTTLDAIFILNIVLEWKPQTLVLDALGVL